MTDPIEIQLGAIHDFLAHVPRDRRVSLSKQITRLAPTNEFARRVVASRAFEAPAGTKRVRTEAPAPVVSVALAGKRLGKERSSAEKRPKRPKQRRPSRNYPYTL